MSLYLTIIVACIICIYRMIHKGCTLKTGLGHPDLLITELVGLVIQIASSAFGIYGNGRSDVPHDYG